MGFIGILLLVFIFLVFIVGFSITKSAILIGLFLLTLLIIGIGIFILKISLIIVTLIVSFIIGAVVTYYIVKAIMNRGKIKCPECGNYIDDESVQCMNCGFKI